MLDGLFIPVIHAATGSRPDEADTIEAAAAVVEALSRLGAVTEVVWVDAGFCALDALAERRAALVFNLVEAVDGDAAGSVEAVSRLEALGLAFTGASSAAYAASSDKLTSKAVLAAASLPTPAWSVDGSGFAPGTLVIVKSVTEHGSLGIDAGSIRPAHEAAGAIRAREARFGNRFYAEAFVDGREFNISVLDGEVLPPAEIDFRAFGPERPRIVDWESKWVETSYGYLNAPRSFAFRETDAGLLADLGRLTLAACRAFGIASYARVDFRVDAAGRVWLLEVNANPCLSPDAGFAAAAAAGGLCYDALIGRIACEVLARSQPLQVVA